MTDKTPPAAEPLSLSDEDITSEPAVTRRSLLGVLGVGAGVAAALALGTARSAHAADPDDKDDDKGKDDDKDDDKDDGKGSPTPQEDND